MMVVFEAAVRTNRDRFSMVRTGGRIIIGVRSPPAEGKANAEIVKELRRLTGRDARILSGFKSKRKVMEIEGFAEADLERLL